MTKKQRTLTTQQKEKIARAKAAYRAWLRRADDLLLAAFGPSMHPSGKAAGQKKLARKRHKHDPLPRDMQRRIAVYTARRKYA